MPGSSLSGFSLARQIRDKNKQTKQEKKKKKDIRVNSRQNKRKTHKTKRVYKVYKYQNISTTAVVNCCTVCGTVFCFLPRLIEYNIVIRCISKHSYYYCTDCDLFSPSQLLSVHVCKGLEFRVGYEAFYGNDHGKRKHTSIHH